MRDFNGFWDSSYELEKARKQHVLKDINFEMQEGELVVVIGRIGSSKTSFLNCFLKEIPSYTGYFKVRGSIAYVEQEPYIYPGTIRENILFGNSFDEPRYREVVKICQMESDLALFPSGDQTEIGERGINLSGGQKARVSLARAVYSDADLYLLDDPLSAVDSKVARRIYELVLRGFLRSKSIILSTHLVQYAQEADQVLVFDQGRILKSGKFSEVIQAVRSENQEYAVIERKSSLNQENDEPNIGKNEDEPTQKEEAKNDPKKGALFTKEEDEKVVVNTTTYLK